MIKQKVLILGSTSQIGRSLMQENQANIELIPASRKDLDLENLDSIKGFIVKNKPDVLINCAAFTHVDNAEEENSLAMKINSLSVKKIVEACNEIGATLIHFSSEYVFDGNTNMPYRETSTPNPLSVYGRSKLAGDKFIESKSSNFLIFRISWVYGAYNNNFLKAILSKIKQKEDLRVVNDQIGSPTTSNLVSQVVLHIISNFNLEDKKEILNLQPEGHTSWFNFAHFINNHLSNIKKLPKECITPVNSEEFNAKALRPNYSLLNTQKIEDAYGISFNSWEEYAIEEIKNLDRLN